jgi:hypothetical protein
MGKAYNNYIDEAEVSLGIERLLVANYPATYTPARIDISSPPSGFYDLGSVVEDTPSLKTSRKKFALETGVPMVRQYEAVIGLTATFECKLHSNSWRKAQFILGNYTYTSSATALGTITSLNGQNSITLSAGGASIAVGSQFTIAPVGGALDNPASFETRATSISSNLVYFDPLPNAALTTGRLVGTYPMVRQAIGTSKILKYSLLGVADFIDGVQVVHYIPKCTPGEDMEEAIRPAENYRIGLMFNAFGVVSTIYGGSELIVAERFYYPTGY